MNKSTPGVRWSVYKRTGLHTNPAQLGLPIINIQIASTENKH